MMYDLSLDLYDTPCSDWTFLLQITDGCSPSWMAHLRGGLQLIELVSSKTTESYLLKKFFVMYFVAHDIMGRTASEDPSMTEPSGYGWLEDDDMEEVCFQRHIALFQGVRN